MRTFHLLTGAVAASLASTAFAADDGICADRPGKSSETCTVPAGHWQIETGLADWALRRGGNERETLLVLGETTVKYGLDAKSDIEVDLTPWERTTSRAGGIHDSAAGIGDVYVNYKRQLTASDAPFQVTLLPFVKIPTAKRSLGNRKFEAGLLVPMGFPLGKSPFSVNLTPEFDLVADEDGHGLHASMSQVASLGWELSPRLNVAGEIWGQWNWDPAATVRQYSADASIAYLASKNVQLDAGANFGLNRETADIELYTGVAMRF